jgi:3-oxoacyl-[acyl-carrier protein] reductase
MEMDIAIVTGASGVLGKEIVKALARRGVKVVAAARERTRLDQCFEDAPPQLRERIEIVELDVTEFEQVEKLFAHTSETHGRIDVLINGAGIYGAIGTVAEVSPREWRRAFDINVMGTFHSCHCILRTMIPAGHGHIINLAGGGASGPLEYLSSYGVSKAAIVRLTDSLANEVRDFGICVNAVLPGPVDSPMQDTLLSAGDRAGHWYAKIRALRDRGEGGVSPESTAALIDFLVYGNGAQLTGKLLSARYDNFQVWTKEQIEQVAASSLYSLRRLDPSTIQEIVSKPLGNF